MGWLCIVSSPVWAKVPGLRYSYQLAINHMDAAYLLQQGKDLYDAGRLQQAVQVLQTAVQEYQKQGNILKEAMSLSNLALSYQQLGAWTEAKQAITQSLNLLKGQENRQSQQILAKSLDIQGCLQLRMGQPEEALTTWQESAKIYQRLENHGGVVKALINQAQAWRSLGFYLRSVKILKELNQQLQSQPDSLEKAVSLRSLGDAFLLEGNLEESSAVLEQSLKIAQRLQSSADMGASLFSLGNNARTQEQTAQAIAYYEQTVKISPSPLTKTQALLNHFSLLISQQKWQEAQNILPLIPPQLAQLPPSRAAIYAQINFADSLKKLYAQNQANFPKIAQILVKAIEQSRSLGDEKAQAYALGSLGGLYEATQQWSEAQKLTQQALILAQTNNATDIIYSLDWQLGRLLWAEKDIQGAIAAYNGAVDSLELLRRDLIAVNEQVQFNFRDSVEPVYRQSVELLLQTQGSNLEQKTLDLVRHRIEALQLAEVENYFREVCLLGKTVALDQLVEKDNSTTAIIYPILLPQTIEVIVKLPHKPLQHYTTNIPQTQVDETVRKLRECLMKPGALKSFKSESQRVYNWLIQPIESELQASLVKNIVFVLDGSLRNLPMASLYDGKQYLVEKYAISLSLGLELLDPKPLVRKQMRALAAGLTQPRGEFSQLASLPGIKTEVDLMREAGILTTSLFNEDFTRKALEKKVNSVPFNIVHIATHAQFSSKADKTFILAGDGPINLRQFNSILRSREQREPEPVELLFLSACQTAAGDNRATLGLAGASIRAGARSTLASLWHLDDQSTALFVGSFYQQLNNSNISKAEALRHAQLKLLHHPNYNTPNFWSAYVLIGNWL